MSSLSAFCTKISVFQARNENFPADVCSTLRLGSRWRNNYSSKQLLVGTDEAGSKSFSLFFSCRPKWSRGWMRTSRDPSFKQTRPCVFHASEDLPVFLTFSQCLERFLHASLNMLNVVTPCWIWSFPAKHLATVGEIGSTACWNAGWNPWVLTPTWTTAIFGDSTLDEPLNINM